MKKRIAVVYGTRPEFIKLAPVILILKKLGDFKLDIINTGQHINMTEDLEDMFKINPDFRFDIMMHNQTLNHILSSVTQKMDDYLNLMKPDFVIVQGDTTTVLASGITCFHRGIPVGHVEAGLRTFNLNHPFPEEFNRKVVSMLSKLNFAPTEKAKKNLLAEFVNPESIMVTGNTIIDAIRFLEESNQISNPYQVGTTNILITAHRRENHVGGINRICEAVKKMMESQPSVIFYWPVHPNPNVKNVVIESLSGFKRVVLFDPLRYNDMLGYVKYADLIWTDSGGIQEECLALCKPVLVLREVTERPEIIESGFGHLVSTDEEKIVAYSNSILKGELTGKVALQNPLGDGYSANKIVEIIKENI